MIAGYYADALVTYPGPTATLVNSWRGDVVVFWAKRLLVTLPRPVTMLQEVSGDRQCHG